MALHFLILYVGFFTRLFAITSLTWGEWQGVLLISAPVILIDEILKFISRNFLASSSKHEVMHSVYAEEKRKSNISKKSGGSSPRRSRSRTRKAKRD